MSKSVGGVHFSGNPVPSAVLAIHDAITRSSVQLHDLKAGANHGSKTAREPHFRCAVLDRECGEPMPRKFTREKTKYNSKGS